MRILEVASLLYITDYFLIVTTGSARQTRALAEGLNEAAKEAGHEKGRIEGAHQSSWVLLDFGVVVCHLLTDEAREFYGLDHLWADAVEVPVDEDRAGGGSVSAREAG